MMAATFSISMASFTLHVPLEIASGGQLPNGSIIIDKKPSNPDNGSTTSSTIVGFGLVKDTINLGESITVNWSTSNASYVTLSDTPDTHRNPSDTYTFSPSSSGNGSITVTSFDENNKAGESKTVNYNVISTLPEIYSVTPNAYWLDGVLASNDSYDVTLVGKNIGCIKWQVLSLNPKCYDVSKVSDSDGYFSVDSYSKDKDGVQTIVVTPVSGNNGTSFIGTGINYVGFVPYTADQSKTGDTKYFSYKTSHAPYVTYLEGGSYKPVGAFSYSNDIDIAATAGQKYTFKLEGNSLINFEDKNSSLKFAMSQAVVVGPFPAGTTVVLDLKTLRHAYDKGKYIGDWTKDNMGMADYVMRITFQ